MAMGHNFSAEDEKATDWEVVPMAPPLEWPERATLD
jgi:hypothetical protein